MNTQTHILLGAAAFTSQGERVRNIAVIIGALLPDIPVFALVFGAKMAGYSDTQIFGDFYFREPMREVMGLFNSFFVAAVLCVLGLLLSGRWIGTLMLFAGAAMLLHQLTDLPLHVDDGHRHFWPFSKFVFNSPVSYWDDNHHGNVVSVLEAVLGIVCAIVLWRRFDGAIVRTLCVVAIAAFVLVPAYWIWTFS